MRECKEVLKGGLLMKQYYQFMLHEVLDHPEKTDCIDRFEEDLHKMLMVRAGPGAREMSDWCVSSPGSFRALCLCSCYSFLLTCLLLLLILPFKIHFRVLAGSFHLERASLHVF